MITEIHAGNGRARANANVQRARALARTHRVTLCVWRTVTNIVVGMRGQSCGRCESAASDRDCAIPMGKHSCNDQRESRKS